jgi:hypothetical protein
MFIKCSGILICKMKIIITILKSFHENTLNHYAHFTKGREDFHDIGAL